jgi:hypothetical protein
MFSAVTWSPNYIKKFGLTIFFCPLSAWITGSTIASSKETEPSNMPQLLVCSILLSSLSHSHVYAHACVRTHTHTHTNPPWPLVRRRTIPTVNKAIPLACCGSLQGCETSRIPHHLLDKRLTDGSEVVILMHRLHFTP